MTGPDAISYMMDVEGISAYAAARRIGRGPSYVSGMVRRGSDPSTAVMASIARACGYQLCLVGHGEVIEIDGLADCGES